MPASEAEKDLLDRIRDTSVRLDESDERLREIEKEFRDWKKGRGEINNGIRQLYQDAVALRNQRRKDGPQGPQPDES